MSLLTNKQDIINWLNEHGVYSYTLIADDTYGYVVDVNEGVNLSGKKLESIDVKFNEIDGDFLCYSNKLISLQGTPKIVHGYFVCAFNNLTSLKDGPFLVHGNFNCAANGLISLEGCPEKIGGSLNCSYNQLTSLKYCSKKIEGYFAFSDNKVKNLKFFPESVGQHVNFENNPCVKHLPNSMDFNILHREHVRLNIINKKKQLAKKIKPIDISHDSSYNRKNKI